jgi:putative aldouronate transport system substrate-binding protein
MLNSQAGATWAPGGSGIGTWLPAMQKTDPNVNFVSAPPMSPEKGKVAELSRMNGLFESGAAISTSCKKIEAAARLLDYSYSEEGHMLVNFGIEGVTYKMENGYPKYTDEIMKNPDGLSIMQAMSKYIRGHISGPFVQDQRELEQYYELPQLQEALQLWTKTNMGKHQMPPVSATSAEAEELAQIMNNVDVYRKEMESKFITGVEPLSKFDEYVAQLKAFGIERAIEITQACYDRYMAR